MAFILLAFGAIGHMVLWVAIINRVHSLGIARFWIKSFTAGFVAALAFAPLAVTAAFSWQRWGTPTGLNHFAAMVAWIYVALCAGLCIVSTVHRLYLWRHPERVRFAGDTLITPVHLHERRQEMIAPGIPALIGALPGNQVLKIKFQQKDILVPRLSPAHQGLRIAHLTDLHMSGRIQPAFYERVVEVINEAEPDIVAVTGDIVEGDAFIEWLPSTLGKLRARYGVYYVLGNHDRRASEATLKQQLAECNLVHLGDNWRQILVNEVPLILAGNELPWYAPAADLSNCVESRSHGRLMRILLAHSPDQLLWARTNDIDLMLAGHLHGGQVRFPIVGAITSPSAFGVRYAAGIFRAGNTIMHVSRGVGALTPIRVNCPPEIALLRLCCGAGDA